ncbi:hypothetical protein ACVPPR_07950 [Dellaglioa sp. L3N]
MEKRRVLAPVAVALEKRDTELVESEKAKLSLRKTIIGLWIVCGLMIITGNIAGGFFVGIVAVAVMVFKNNFWVKPAIEELETANKKLSQERNNEDYINGKDGFPEKFYTYTDAFRLWKLINEGRAESLKESYNLLETQHFHEDQLSIQEEMRSLQEDTAASAKMAAIASTVSAVNTTFKK